jgi:hypothetical protein
MKKILTISTLLLLAFIGQTQVYDSAGFVKVKPVLQYRDTGSIKYRDTGRIVYVPGPIQYIHDTLWKHDTLYVQAPVTPPATGTINVTFPQISNTIEVQNTGRGVEQWHNAFEVPVYGSGVGSLNVYYRFAWTQVEGSTQGSYNWTYFDGLINLAIQKKQKFSFGIMTLNPDGGNVSYGGGTSYYPQYLHNLMQAESVKDWLKNGVWVPNYNSDNYYSRLLALHQAINAHLETGSFNGVRYKDVIQYIDIRGYGSWGEWHHGSLVDDVSQLAPGILPSISSLKRIIDAHLLGFPNYRLVAMIAGFDAGSTQIPLFYSPPEVAYYLLTAKNNAGEIGWRRDQWGATDPYLSGILENNRISYNGVALKTLIMNKWKNAPIVGEPPSWNDQDFKFLPTQVKLYHGSSFGNGNYGVTVNSTISSNVKAASSSAGYNITLRTATITTGSTTTIALNWENKYADGSDRAPTYDNWDIIYYVNGVQIGKSSFNLKYFTGSKTTTDSFTGIPKGVLTIKIVDPAGYAKPLGLPISTQTSDRVLSVATLN